VPEDTSINSIIKLSPRLKTVAGFVRPGAKVVDVGTDHARVPVYLVANGITEYALATDIKPGPLQNAKDTIESYELAGKIDLRLSDGLLAVDASEAEDVIIAGMGGDLIIEIIKGAPWLCAPSKLLIMQPMSQAHRLRAYLCKAGFHIVREEACLEGKRVYIALSARYEPGLEENFDESYFYIGELKLNKNEAAGIYLKKVKNSLNKKVKALREKTPGSPDLKELEDVIKTIDAALEEN